MPKKLNLLFATEDFYPQSIGGQGIFGYQLIENLSWLNCRLTVLAENRNGRIKFWQEKNLDLILTPYSFGNQLILALFEYLIFRIKLSKKSFDVLHANQLSSLFFILFRPKNIKKIVVSIHNTNLDLNKITKSRSKKFFYKLLIAIEKFIYKKADLLLFHSNWEKIDFQKNSEFLNIYPQIIPMGTSLPATIRNNFTLEKQKFKAKYKFSKNQKIILTIARLVEKKRIDQLIKAIIEINKKNLKVSLIIIGEGRDRKKLLKTAPNNVIFLGHKDYQELDYFYRISDIFLLPSEAEGGLSLSALQATEYNLPLILSREIAYPILKDNYNGKVLKKNYSKNISEAILHVCKNYNLMKKNSFKIKKPPSWKGVALKTFNFYRGLVD